MVDVAQGPYERLGVLAKQSVQVADGLVHHELFTMQGLLTILWHGPPDAEHAVVAVGGAMGGLLGPSDGLYQALGARFADEGIATLRVSYRAPNDLGRCVHDALAAADVAARQGARRFVTIGHSFGGAVAVQLGMAMGDFTAGVVTLATQSAGCEDAEGLADTPMLLSTAPRTRSSRRSPARSCTSSPAATANSSSCPARGICCPGPATSCASAWGPGCRSDSAPDQVVGSARTRRNARNPMMPPTA